MLFWIFPHPANSKLWPVLFLAALLTAYCGASRAWGAEGELLRKDLPLEITADSLTFDSATATYLARGHAVLVQDLTTLRADTVMLNISTGVAEAAGNVEVVDEGGNVLSGEGLTMDLKARTAVVAKARIFYREENIHLLADSILKTGPESYEASRLTYTACDCAPDETPAWSFRVSEARVTIGEFMTGRDAFFYIKGVPVLYTPYLSAPVKTERQTGFLQPRPGYSELRGFILDNAFFWAISGSTDATFYLDMETSRGLGGGAEYRYIRTTRSYGEFYFYGFEEDDIGRVREFRADEENLSRPLSAGDDRWMVKYRHTERLADGLSLRADINEVSDDEYFIDFGADTAERALESLESNVSVSKSWHDLSLVLQASVSDNLLDGDDAETLQRLPEAALTGPDRMIPGTPLYLSIESSYAYFHSDEGPAGQRLDLHPRISLPLSPGAYFDLTASIAPRATFYAEAGQDEAYYDRYLYDATLDLSTTFVRVFEGVRSLKALKHTIRPRLAYTYIPETVQDDLPQFDSTDDIEEENTVAYSLNTTLAGRLADNGTREYLYFEAGQDYDINEASRALAPGEDRRPLSAVKAELRLYPAQWADLTGEAEYDVYERSFASYDASIAARDARGDSLDLSYRYVDDGSGYAEASLRARATRAVDLTYAKRFSLDDRSSLETSYGVEYTHQCWSAVLSYAEKLEEQVVYLTFDLAGIGRIAGITAEIAPP
jgi:LPS-assembly protein